jgi:rare lipoprotein A (peptidoglycan hydrolase)
VSFVKVTNTATGAQATARVVDECHNVGLDLDAAVFSEIDTDGAGAAGGNLVIDYEFVDCQDKNLELVQKTPDILYYARCEIVSC